MGKTKTPITLTGFDELFNVVIPQNGESIQMLPLIDLHAPDPHPFIVRDDVAM